MPLMARSNVGWTAEPMSKVEVSANRQVHLKGLAQIRGKRN